jgi:hypothetical protein
MKYIIIIIFFLSAYSCTTQRKVERYLNEHKEYSASYCAGQFKVKTDTLTIVSHDSILIEHYNESIDTILIDTNQTKERIIYETKYKIKEVIKNNPPIKEIKIVEKENTAKVISLTYEINKKNAIINRLQRFKNTTYLIALIIVSLLLIYMVIKYKKLI